MAAGLLLTYNLAKRRCVMGTVIYSASPVQAFMGAASIILFLLGLGVVGIGVAIFRRGQSRGSRIGLGIAAVFLILVSIVYAGFSLASASGRTKSVVLNLDNKQVAEDNCGDNGETCARYVLESIASGTAYDFNVPQEAYDKAQVDTCYQFTYYPNNGLFSSSNDSYQQINNVARIETADPSSCH
jgi:hypothetical protein